MAALLESAALPGTHCQRWWDFLVGCIAGVVVGVWIPAFVGMTVGRGCGGIS